MAGYDIGVGVPVGSSAGESVEPISGEVAGDATAPGADHLGFSGAPSRATGGDYDLGLASLTGTNAGEFIEPLEAGVVGEAPPTGLVQSPGNPPPPETGIPFEAENQTFTGNRSVEVTAFADILCLMEPTGVLAPVVTVAAPGDFKPTSPTFDIPFDMFGTTVAGTTAGRFPEPTQISEKTGPAPETFPTTGPAYPPVLDALPPTAPSYGTIDGSQINGDPKGRTQVVVRWTAPSVSQELSGEYLGDATGGSQDLLSEYPPVTASSYDLFEVTGFTVGGGDTALSSGIVAGDFKLPVNSPTNFTLDSWVEVEDGAIKEYGQILAINGSVLTLYNPLIETDFTSGSTVKNVDVVQKTETTDYTVNTSNGTFSLVAGQFTATNPVFARYTQDITDLGGFKLYRIPSLNPLPDGATLSEVTGHGSVVIVDDALGAGATSATETLDATENGTFWTYYLFANDSNGNVSRAQAVYVETLVSKIQSLQATAASGSITLSWDASTDANFDGVNIYRSPGGSFDPANATQVNSILVTGTSFEDGPGNVTNRRTPGEIAYPAGGQTYSYSVEAQDTATDWNTGTQNQSLDPLKSLVGTATKTD